MKLTQADQRSPTPLPAGTRGAVCKLRAEERLSLGRIAKRLGVTKQTVWNHLQHPESVAFLTDVFAGTAEAVRIEVLSQAPGVVDKVRRIALGLDDAKRDQIAAAKLYLAWGGVAATEAINVSGGLNITADSDEDLEARARTLAAAVLGEVEKPPPVEEGETP